MRQRIAFITLFGLCVALGFMMLGAGPVLPDRVATHFGANGLPNGWMSRDGFMKSIVAIVLAPVGVVQALGFLADRLPPSLVNLPNKEYWLAPERRAQTMARVRTSLLEFGNAMFAFLLFVTWSIIEANTTGDRRLGGSFGYGLFAFLAFVAVWTFLLVKPYLRTPDSV